MIFWRRCSKPISLGKYREKKKKNKNKKNKKKNNKMNGVVVESETRENFVEGGQPAGDGDQ